MNRKPLTRRDLLKMAGLLTVTGATGCGTNLPFTTPGEGLIPGPGNQGILAFQRRGKGRHISNAAKKHNANRVYASRAAALSDIPHPGDRSDVVEIMVSKELHDELFAAGNPIVDLRRFYA